METKTYHPLVSVALTTSKSERFLKEQMDSILNQTYTNLEVVVSHDECGDGTVAMLEEYVRRDPRVRWEYNKLEKGFIKNSENAILMCKGDIIFTCDHDDVWDLDRVRLHVKEYEDPEVVWVYNKSKLIDAEGKEIGFLETNLPNYYSKSKITLLNLVWGTCMGAAHTSYRAKYLKEAFPPDPCAPGHDAWIQLYLYPKKFVFIDKYLILYRQHGNNQVGLTGKLSKEDFEKREKLAIEGNMLYLKSLSHNTRLAVWKRFFFFSVYVAKRVRATARELLHLPHSSYEYK